MLDETVQKITEKIISIHLLERGEFQPRQQFDEAALKTLAESIRQNGILQALLVRPLMNGHYEIIAGERRWRPNWQDYMKFHVEWGSLPISKRFK